MRVLMVARDIAPSTAFERLAKRLELDGHIPTLMVGKGKPPDFLLHDIKNAVSGADIVVIGMSSSRELAEPEIVACKAAITANKPFGFYGDTFRCHERARDNSWFGAFRHATSFFFAINGGEVEGAQTIFPNAKIVATGNPTWEDYVFPKFSRKEAREMLGIADDETLILSPGTKDPVMNILIWGKLLDALAYAPGRKYRVVLSCHPGDRTPVALDPKDQKPMDIYESIVKFSPVPTMFSTSGIKTSNFVPGANLVVDWGTSISIESGHLRIPSISVASEIGKRRLESTSNTRELDVVTLGASILAPDNPIEFMNQIVHLTHPGGERRLRDNLRQTQETVFPAPAERGTAVRKMAEVLVSSH